MENFGQKLKWLIMFGCFFLLGWLLLAQVFACYGTCNGFLAFMNSYGIIIYSIISASILAFWIIKNFKGTRPE
jgi:hypothetical protein